MMDFGNVLRNSFTLWYKDGKTLKYMLFYLGATVLSGLLFIGSGLLFFGDFIAKYLDLVTKYSSNTLAQPDPSAVTALLNSFLSNIIPFIIVAVPILIASAIVIAFIRILMVLRALEALGFSTAPFGPVKFIKLFILDIWVSIMALTGWYNRKLFLGFLLLAGFMLVTMIIAFLFPLALLILFFVWFALWIAYIVVIIYNSIRLSFAGIMFLQNDKGILETARGAWVLTHGKALDIFLGFLVFGIALVAIQLIVSIPLFILRVVLDLVTPGLGILAQIIIDVLIAPVWAAIMAFSIPAIYLELLKGSQPTPPTLPATGKGKFQAKF